MGFTGAFGSAAASGVTVDLPSSGLLVAGGVLPSLAASVGLSAGFSSGVGFFASPSGFGSSFGPDEPDEPVEPVEPDAPAAERR